jgi:hypothetical protein
MDAAYETLRAMIHAGTFDQVCDKCPLPKAGELRESKFASSAVVSGLHVGRDGVDNGADRNAQLRQT